MIAYQNIMINRHPERQNKNTSKKRFVEVVEKYLKKKRGILKYIWWEVIWEKLMFRMLCNILKNGSLLPAKWKPIYEIFPSEHAQSYGFYLIRASLNFFYENYWPHLTSSSKCSGGMSHSEIKFWFSGNANTGTHCLLLRFHLSF